MTSYAPEIRVIVVDDHAVVRQGLQTLLQFHEDLVLVGEGTNGREAVKLCETAQPDVALIDLIMPEMDGIEATRIIRRRFPSVEVVVLTSYQENNKAYDVIEAGAIAYLTKTSSGDELVEAIRAAYAGRPSLAPVAVEALISATIAPVGPEKFTPREKEVLNLMAEGLNSPQIAERLDVSRSTAKSHVSKILAKMNAKSRTEAVATAFQNNLVA